MKQFLGNIKETFEKNNLSLTQPQAVSRYDKVKVDALEKLVSTFEKFNPTKGHISTSCQNRINDFVLLLQIFYKANKKTLKDERQSNTNKSRPRHINKR